MKTSDLDFAKFVREGDNVIWGQVTGEPCSLTTELLEQRARIGNFSVFLGLSFSDTVQPEHTDIVTFNAIGGGGTNRRLSKIGRLGVVPTHISALAQSIERNELTCDVVIVQVTPSDLAGHYEYAVVSDYIVNAVAKARVVIGELNAAAPRTRGVTPIPKERFAFVFETERPVLEVPSSPAGTLEMDIARNVSSLIEDGSVLQVGIGAVPDAVMSLMSDRRDLGVHSGMIGDSVVDLIERGIVTNERKPFDKGISVAGALIGTKRLYRFADYNPSIELHSTNRTHSLEVLARIPQLVSINSAVEVDLSGQVNSEVVGGVHIGAVGGQVDFVRGANLSQGGRSIIALPSTASDGKVSRIVPTLSGPVTTARSDRGYDNHRIRDCAAAGAIP